LSTPWATRIQNFFSLLSGRFNVKRDKWKVVNLKVYYNPGYEFDLDKMMESAKAGLDYYETSFGPFEFTQIPRVGVSALPGIRAIIPEYL
jgi:aminopeptidase N